MNTELELRLGRLVKVSRDAFTYLTNSLGRLATAASARRLREHGNECRRWLLDCAGEQPGADWLDKMTDVQRLDFEEAVLPHCLLINGRDLIEAYDIIADCLGDKGFHERFPTGAVRELMELLESSRIDDSGHGMKTKDGTLPLSISVIPPIIKNESVLAPEIYGPAVRFKQFSNFKAVAHAAFNDLIDESMAHRALDAISWEGAGSKSYKLIRTELLAYSPNQLPGLRERLTGSPGPTPAECSQRLFAVISSLYAGGLNQSADFLVEAIRSTPDYRREVLPLDLAEVIAERIGVFSLAVESESESIQRFIQKFGYLLDRLDLSVRELNLMMAKSVGHGYANNGGIYELMQGDEHEMLRRFLKYSKAHGGQKQGKHGAAMHAMLISRCSYSDMVAAIDGDSGLAAYAYIMTNDHSYLALIKDGRDLDDCLGRDLGL
ncbi:hypothetical protein [Pseudomonas amygdali]|uniref:Uncharacterized protein n=2 Tax=Pseudomonas amygdali pv. lachrymans TaxID=53707 RepID=A0ABR5KTA5_PSEAV|nr:hypothetical protein [Pseudomonas amygdali]KPC17075.1 Uncharacterized protein AC499_0277 [Pseudomonas amygdali pv. lachrymans]KPC18034.1 Uncharacterized protein AC499_1236 [Pseudomonas amygdali pv. lachrymans]